MAKVLFDQVGQQEGGAFFRLQECREIIPALLGFGEVVLLHDFSVLHELRMQAIGAQEQQQGVFHHQNFTLPMRS